MLGARPSLPLYISMLWCFVTTVLLSVETIVDIIDLERMNLIKILTLNKFVGLFQKMEQPYGAVLAF